jgi:hypothetical protein
MLSDRRFLAFLFCSFCLSANAQVILPSSTPQITIRVLPNPNGTPCVADESAGTGCTIEFGRSTSWGQSTLAVLDVYFTVYKGVGVTASDYRLLDSKSVPITVVSTPMLVRFAAGPKTTPGVTTTSIRLLPLHDNSIFYESPEYVDFELQLSTSNPNSYVIPRPAIATVKIVE